MEKKKLAALATVLILVSAGTGVALLMVLSNSLDYDVDVEGTPITLVEVSGPSETISRGTNHTFHATATVNGGSWNSYFVVNVTSNLLSDSTYLHNYTVYLNDTKCTNVFDASTPDTYQSHDLLGVISEGDEIELYWTIYFDYSWPVGAFNIVVYIDGESQ